MLQTLPSLLTFDEFIAWLPENSEARYELHQGNIITMPNPVGEHEEIKGFLTIEIAFAIKQQGLPYVIPNQAIVRPVGKESGYFPDILVLNRDNLGDEARWKKESILSQKASIPLVIEVVSTNWRDDYYEKYSDYEALGIAEYWIVDYAALGSRNFLGDPKQPTISICSLVEGEYQVQPFRLSDRLLSPTLPNLTLTVEQIFASVLN